MINTQSHQKQVVVVLDIGSLHTSAGFAGDSAPKVFTSSYVATDTSLKSNQQKAMVGNQVLKADRTDLQIQHIFETCGRGGYQYNFQKYMDFVEALLADNLKVGDEKLSILFTEDVVALPYEIQQQRQKISEMLFQQFQNINNITFMKKPTLSCFSVGRPTGIIVDSGHIFSRASVIHDGYCIASQSIPYGGKTINNIVEEIIQKQSNAPFKILIETYEELYREKFILFHRQQELNRIKQNFSTSSEDMERIDQYEYILPDQQKIKINRNFIHDPFVNFPQFWKTYFESEKPQYGYEFSKYSGYRSLASLVMDVAQRPQCQNLGQQIYENILLTGGNSFFSNIETDFKLKMIKLKENANFCQNLNKKMIQSWIGGSIVGQMSSFAHFWISKEQWKEGGAKTTQQNQMANQSNSGINIINKKCQ